jgi:uncharacterized protein YciI
MFVVLLTFSDNKGRAGDFMDDHNAWIRRGFDDGVFLLTGSLRPGLGGGILAHATSLPDLQARVDEDPFVVHDVVSARIFELAPTRTSDRLDFLRAEP